MQTARFQSGCFVAFVIQQNLLCLLYESIIYFSYNSWKEPGHARPVGSNEASPRQPAGSFVVPSQRCSEQRVQRVLRCFVTPDRAKEDRICPVPVSQAIQYHIVQPAPCLIMEEFTPSCCRLPRIHGKAVGRSANRCHKPKLERL